MPSDRSIPFAASVPFERRKVDRLSETRLANSQRIARLGDWEHDLINDRLLWSEEIYRILGLERNDGAPDSAKFYALVHPDDLAFVHQQKDIVSTGVRGGDFEHRIVRSDGEIRHVHQIAEMVYDDTGRPIRETGTLQDITERKHAELTLRESEERFKLVAGAMSDVVWDWNIPANTLWWSEGFHTTFGFAVAQNKPGIESWSGHIHPDERTRVVAGIHHAIDTGAESWSADFRFQRKDGGYVCVQNRGYILRDSTHQPIRMVGGMRDLTEQKNMEAQLLRAQRMESIGALAGGIAHDLNNVLAPILMSIELLQLDSGSDPRRTRILDTIHSSCCRGADLVRQVLTFARGVNGQRLAVLLPPLIAEIRETISSTFPRNIRITAEVAPNLWPVIGDPSQLHQVLLNLAVNARDALVQGGTLMMAATNVMIDSQYAGTTKGFRHGQGQKIKAGPHVLFQLTDTGQGMSAEVQARIFEPFFTTKPPGQGTGIGLATVLTVVKNHGGFLEVQSQPGRGTTFKIFLPADPDLRIHQTVTVPSESPRGQEELILVVDDEASIRSITQQTLEAFGYRVITAADGAQAVALFARHVPPVALVLTDMMMPNMDGPATIRVLRSMDPTIPIIAVSGLSDRANISRASDAGIHDFLAKPYTAETLLTLVHEVLHRPVTSATRLS
jgi:PAS domain S-box-containing protein